MCCILSKYYRASNKRDLVMWNQNIIILNVFRLINVVGPDVDHSDNVRAGIEFIISYDDRSK